ncbi:hypothetical protein V6R21_21295 [Limibacter armeniacum]|uniref:hypothetical protein n=1 Tax=Limibacter armeniacum TaxID=466084 RepID=UPI002FE65E0E
MMDVLYFMGEHPVFSILMTLILGNFASDAVSKPLTSYWRHKKDYLQDRLKVLEKEEKIKELELKVMERKNELLDNELNRDIERVLRQNRK